MFEEWLNRSDPNKHAARLKVSAAKDKTEEWKKRLVFEKLLMLTPDSQGHSHICGCESLFDSPAMRTSKDE